MPASPSFCLLYSDERLHRHVKEGNGMHTAHTVNVEIPVTAVDMLVPVGPSKRKKTVTGEVHLKLKTSYLVLIGC